MEKLPFLNKNNKIYILLLITFIVAASSILYELLLGQMLSAFFGNTIREYSITIGLYMFSMGIGALISEGRVVKNALHTFLWVEIILSIIGGMVVIFAYLLNDSIANIALFNDSLYFLIIIIGILTGMEIPLLFKLGAVHKKNFENVILGVDYAGAFLGSLLFAFFFYPLVGLTATAFIVSLGNAVAGIMLYTQIDKQEANHLFYIQLILLSCIAIGMIILIEHSPEINEKLINLYLS